MFKKDDEIYTNYRKTGGNSTAQGGNQDFLTQYRDNFKNVIKQNVYKNIHEEEFQKVSDAFNQAESQMPMPGVYQTGGGINYGASYYGSPNMENAALQDQYLQQMANFQNQDAQDRNNFRAGTVGFASNLYNAFNPSYSIPEAQRGVQVVPRGEDYKTQAEYDAANEAYYNNEIATSDAEYNLNQNKTSTQADTTTNSTTQQNLPWAQQLAQLYPPTGRTSGLKYFPANVQSGYEFGKSDMAKLSRLTAEHPMTGVQLNYGALGKVAPRFFGPKSITFGTVNPNKGYFEDLNAPVSFNNAGTQSEKSYDDMNRFQKWKDDRRISKLSKQELEGREFVNEYGPDAYKAKKAYNDMNLIEKIRSNKAAKRKINETTDQAKRFEESQNAVGITKAYGGLLKAQDGNNPIGFDPRIYEDDPNIEVPKMPEKDTPVDPNYNPFTDQAAIQKRRAEQRDMFGPPMDDQPDILAPDSVTAKRKIKGVGQAIGQYAVPFMDKISSMFEGRQNAKTQREYQDTLLANNAFQSTPLNAKNRGDYDVNSGMLRPDDYVPVQFPGSVAEYGGYMQNGGYYTDQDYFQTGGMYNEGEELDLTDEEIAALEAQGYTIERQ